jgi:GT2 family glycosyltransferase
MVSEVKHIRSAVVICTRNRPADVRGALGAMARDRANVRVVVVDASTDDETSAVCARFHQDNPGIELHYARADRPGLPQQRNQAVVLCRALGVDVVHFIDDDTEILRGYLDALEARFDREPEVLGVGGRTVEGQRGPSGLARRLWSSFYLFGEPLTVLPSGHGHAEYEDVHATGRVQWLRGCCMSYRMAAFESNAFDERLGPGPAGYGLGDDLDFGFRVSRIGRLVVEPGARCIHHLAPSNRTPAYHYGHDRVVHRYVWLTERESAGLSLRAFWWSVFGDLVMLSARALIRRDGQSMRAAAGTLAGVVTVIRGSGGRVREGSQVKIP